MPNYNKMKSQIFSIAAILLILISACNTQPKEEKLDLKAKVLEVHDQVMPKMKDLRVVQKQLLVLADSSADSLKAVKYQQLANDLKLANESMMDWMRSFDPNFSGTEEEVQKYLNEQLKDIEEVKKDMLESLEKGQSAVNQ